MANEEEGKEKTFDSGDPTDALEKDVQRTLGKQKGYKGPREVTAWIVGDKVVDKSQAWNSLQQEAGADLRKQMEEGVGPDLFDGKYPAEKPQPLRKDSKQIVSDTIQQSLDAGPGTLTVVRPPYSLDQLLYLRELQPLHSAALEQLVADVVGNGHRWAHKGPTEDEGELTKAIEFTEEPNSDDTFLELMQKVWLDRRTIGFGCFEIVRQGDTQVIEIWHVPSHTIRIKEDNKRFLQQRAGKFVWFKRWGEKRRMSALTGLWEDEMKDGQKIDDTDLANELFLFKMPTGRSSFYPIPGYVSAIASIATALALHDYNRTFFTRYAIPSWAILLEGAELTPALKTTIEAFFRSEVRGNPHRVLTLSLPYFPIRQTGENRVKITFTRLSDQVKDMSFRYLNQAVSLEIVIAHRMPPYRIGWPITGSLGGSSAKEMNVMYKTGVVNPEQAILQARMTKFFKVEFGVEKHTFDLTELDITDAQEDMTFAVQGIKGVVHTIDEGRKIINLQPLPNGKGKLLVLPGGYTLYDPEKQEFLTPPKNMGTELPVGPDGQPLPPGTSGAPPVPGQPAKPGIPVPAAKTPVTPANGVPKPGVKVPAKA
jgi:PBSX family phage portal protein